MFNNTEESSFRLCHKSIDDILQARALLGDAKIKLVGMKWELDGFTPLEEAALDRIDQQLDNLRDEIKSIEKKLIRFEEAH